VPDSGDLLSCSFCGQSRKQVKVMIVGSHGHICDQCVSRTHTVMAAPEKTASTPITTIKQVSDQAGEQQCGFCEKRRQLVAAMASAGETRICNECLELCDVILDGVPPVPSR
jgi:ATP-dependent protease Clp ATPase subunit